MVAQHTFQDKPTQLFRLGMRGILVHKSYDRQSFSFISGVAPLPARLDSTPEESRRNTSITLLRASLVSTLVELLASPLYVGSLSLLSPYSFFIFSKILHIFIFITVHNTYSFQRWERDPELLRVEEVVPEENYFIISLMCLLRFSPSPYST